MYHSLFHLFLLDIWVIFYFAVTNRATVNFLIYIYMSFDTFPSESLGKIFWSGLPGQSLNVYVVLSDAHKFLHQGWVPISQVWSACFSTAILLDSKVQPLPSWIFANLIGERRCSSVLFFISLIISKVKYLFISLNAIWSISVKYVIGTLIRIALNL